MKTLEEKNLETISAFIDAFWNKNDFDAADRFLSDDYQELSYGSKEGLKKFAKSILDSFPDKQYSIEEIIAEGEKVLVRMVVKGTHKNMFLGTPPTDNQINVTLYRRYRVVDGKITEHHGWIDIVTMMSQIRGK